MVKIDYKQRLNVRQQLSVKCSVGGWWCRKREREMVVEKLRKLRKVQQRKLRKVQHRERVAKKLRKMQKVELVQEREGERAGCGRGLPGWRTRSNWLTRYHLPLPLATYLSLPLLKPP